jgi:hypothetical protein
MDSTEVPKDSAPFLQATDLPYHLDTNTFVSKFPFIKCLGHLGSPIACLERNDNGESTLKLHGLISGASEQLDEISCNPGPTPEYAYMIRTRKFIDLIKEFTEYNAK